MQIRTKQYAIVIMFSLMSVFVYKYGVNIDHGTLSLSANVSNYSYSVGRSEFECATSRCTQILKPSSYTLAVTKPGFLNHQQDIKIAQKQNLDLEIDLEPIPTVVEVEVGQFELQNFAKDNFIWNRQAGSTRKVLSLDTNRQVSGFSYNSQENSAMVIYDQKDVYYYNLNDNQSIKLKLPLNFLPKQIQNFTNSTFLISSTENQVFQASINNAELEMVTVQKIQSVRHFLPVRNGYLAVLPTNLNQNEFTLSDIAISGIENADGVLSNDSIKSKYGKVDRGLFYYSKQSNQITLIADIGIIEAQDAELLPAISDKNSTPILKTRKGFYKIQL